MCPGQASAISKNFTCDLSTSTTSGAASATPQASGQIGNLNADSGFSGPSDPVGTPGFLSDLPPDVSESFSNNPAASSASDSSSGSQPGPNKGYNPEDTSESNSARHSNQSPNFISGGEAAFDSDLSADSSPAAPADFDPEAPGSPGRRLRGALRGLLSTWGTFSRAGTSLGQFGARFLPEFSLELDLQAKTNPPVSARPERETPGSHQPFIINRAKALYPTFDGSGSPAAAIPGKPERLIHSALVSVLANKPQITTGNSCQPGANPAARPLPCYQNQPEKSSSMRVKRMFSATPVPLPSACPASSSFNPLSPPASSAANFLPAGPPASGFLSGPFSCVSASGTAPVPSAVTAIVPPYPSRPADPDDTSNPPHLPSTAAVPDTPSPLTRLTHSSTLTLEFSLNTWGTLTIQQGAENHFDGKIKPYRLSLKYASSRFEARLGLQKISFGSASLLRSLMWFDRIDPRDPIQLTDGVYGLLLRAYISTRTNLWAWVLYGNHDLRGWEILPTRWRQPELGVRAQIPAGPGELALTAHHRHADFNRAMADNNPALLLIPLKPASPLAFTFSEIRLAADGKWDIGPGLWFEAALTNQHSPFLAFTWQRTFTIGLDYTFATGNGLHLLTEYFQSDLATAALSGMTFAPFRARFLAASASYPLTLLDHLSSIFFYDTVNRNLYSFIRWQRTYDRWSLNLMAFWNPTEFRIFTGPGSGQPNLFAGKGLQLLLVYTF